MSTYKTTEQGVRDCYSLNSETYAFSSERASRFDRWLASVKAEAWDEGSSHSAGKHWFAKGGEYRPENPYRFMEVAE